MKKARETFMHILFLIAACTSILAVVLICVFLFSGGVPAMLEIGVFKFLFGTIWKPGNNLYGIFPMIIGSLYVTAGAILFGVPLGLLAAVFMARFCPKTLYRILKPAIELMAGIPFGHLRFLCSGCDCTVGKEYFRRQRPEYPGGCAPSRIHDPSDDH